MIMADRMNPEEERMKFQEQFGAAGVELTLSSMAGQNMEIFQAYINAGFTPRQAMFLSAVVLNENPICY